MTEAKARRERERREGKLKSMLCIGKNLVRRENGRMRVMVGDQEAASRGKRILVAKSNQKSPCAGLPFSSRAVFCLFQGNNFLRKEERE